MRSTLFIPLALAACGGGSALAPLEHSFDDAHLAQVPIDDKQTVLAASSAVSRAEMELDAAEAALTDAKGELRFSESRLKQARLESGARADQKSASDERYNTAKTNAAGVEVQGAHRLERIADARVAYGRANVEAKKHSLREAIATLNAAEARRELEEARAADRHGISPPGPSIAKLEKQLETRLTTRDRERDAAEKSAQNALAVKAEWEELKAASEARRASE